MSGNFTHLSDHDLVVKIDQGNIDSLKELMDRYIDMATLTSYRILCDHSDSLLVTRNVFVKVWKHPPSHYRNISLRLWLLKNIIRQCRKRIFINRLAELLRLRQSLFVSSRPRVEDMDDYITTQAWEVFCRACLSASARQRIIYSLYELDGFSDDDIEQLTGIHKRGIYMVIGSVRDRVRMQLGKFGKAGKYAPFVSFLKKVRDHGMDNEKLEMEILYLCEKLH